MSLPYFDSVPHAAMQERHQLIATPPNEFVIHSVPCASQISLPSGQFKNNELSINTLHSIGNEISIACGRVVLEKFAVAQLVKNFSVFYGIRRFITMATRPRHWTLSWASWIHSTSSNHVSLRSTLILSLHLYLDVSVVLPFRFSDQNEGNMCEVLI
jgi:hypothetical protein